jgi:hypothetical protein
MEFLLFAVLVAFSLGLGAGLYFARVRAHLIYRAVVASIVAPAFLFFISALGAYAINTNYFPREDHRYQLIWAYAALALSIITLLESIFCFVPRMFTRTV